MPEQRRSSGYCCAGCEAVHGLLSDQDLLRFYELGGRDTGPVGAVPRVPACDWLPELVARATDAAGRVTLALDVQGIRCAACVWLLRQVWRRQQGALDIQVDPSLGRVQLLAQRGADLAGYVQSMARLGYPMAPASKTAVRDHGMLIRLGICAALAMNGMLLGLSRYLGLEQEGGALRDLFANLGLVLATLSLLVGGPVFFRAAVAGLRHRVVHMDLPIALGMVLAWAGSIWAHLQGGDSYFDTVSLFVFLMLGGRWVQQRTLARNREQLLADDGSEHLRARRLVGDRVEVVPVAALREGDEILLARGDLLPVDARLLGDACLFSLDWINGEAEARTFARGERIPAGAFHAGSGAVRVAALDGYAGSGLARLLQRTPEDLERARGVGRFWELLNRWYAAGVLVVAALGGATWALVQPDRALSVVVAVLVVTCPCALGLAVPLAFHLTLARLRRQGVFVRRAALLDKLLRVRHVCFDKTGTVTFGGLRAEALQLPDGVALDVLATMTASSSHPKSQAVFAMLPASHFLPGLQVHEVPGQGLLATHGGREHRLGSPEFVGACGSDGPLLFTVGDRVAGRFLIDEDYRDGAADEIAALQERGLDVQLLSGDRPERVAAAAARLGIDAAAAHGGMSPQDKARHIAAIDRDDTLMVGDGVNDAPAFAAACCAGTPAIDRPVLPARADFYFRGAQAGAVLALFDAAHALRGTVTMILWRALFYNAVVLTTSLLGLMTPLLCAILMPISSLLLIVSTTARLSPRRARRAP